VRIEPFGRKGTSLAETPNDLVVLLRGRRRHRRTRMLTIDPPFP
jgi:hypothetical protein